MAILSHRADLTFKYNTINITKHIRLHKKYCKYIYRFRHLLVLDTQISLNQTNRTTLSNNHISNIKKWLWFQIHEHSWLFWCCCNRKILLWYMIICFPFQLFIKLKQQQRMNQIQEEKQSNKYSHLSSEIINNPQ